MKNVKATAFLNWNSEMLSKGFPKVKLKDVFKDSFKTSTSKLFNGYCIGFYIK